MLDITREGWETLSRIPRDSGLLEWLPRKTRRCPKSAGPFGRRLQSDVELIQHERHRNRQGEGAALVTPQFQVDVMDRIVRQMCKPALAHPPDRHRADCGVVSSIKLTGGPLVAV